MQKNSGKDQISTIGLDKHLDNYKQELEADLTRVDPDPFECSFKDTCYANKFKTGNCPCELIK